MHGYCLVFSYIQTRHSDTPIIRKSNGDAALGYSFARISKFDLSLGLTTGIMKLTLKFLSTLSDEHCAMVSIAWQISLLYMLLKGVRKCHIYVRILTTVPKHLEWRRPCTMHKTCDIVVCRITGSAPPPLLDLYSRFTSGARCLASSSYGECQGAWDDVDGGPHGGTKRGIPESD
jgi:hypothetical protein